MTTTDDFVLARTEGTANDSEFDDQKFIEKSQFGSDINVEQTLNKLAQCKINDAKTGNQLPFCSEHRTKKHLP